jgi:hypothetical protein
VATPDPIRWYRIDREGATAITATKKIAIASAIATRIAAASRAVAIDPEEVTDGAPGPTAAATTLAL